MKAIPGSRLAVDIQLLGLCWSQRSLRLRPGLPVAGPRPPHRILAAARGRLRRQPPATAHPADCAAGPGPRIGSPGGQHAVAVRRPGLGRPVGVTCGRSPALSPGALRPGVTAPGGADRDPTRHR
nr:hypothetical protein KPHV_57290 [Kitasatospora purpeofusca]